MIQVGAQVIGNDAAITIAGSQGQFELNVRVPLIARNLLDSIKLLASASRLLDEKCVAGIEANEEMTERHAEATLATATALNPHIGYDRAAEIVKEAARVGPLAARGRAREGRRARRSSTRRSTTASWPGRTSSEAAVPLADPDHKDLRPVTSKSTKRPSRPAQPCRVTRRSSVSSRTA